MSQTFSKDFIEYLQKMVNDRGKMATLRKGLIENQADATFPLLNRFINFDNHYQIKALQTAAGLFGHHPKNTDSGNFGTLCHRLLDDKEKKEIAEGESGSISKHFQYALAANGAEIFSRVKRLIMRAKTEDIPINYIRLTDDLLGWQKQYKRERIKLEWAKEFWKINSNKDEDENPNLEDEGDEND